MEVITIDEFDSVYQLFEQSFPIGELRPYDMTKQLFEHNDFNIYALKEDNQLQGAMIVWPIGNSYIYIENFAVQPSQRGSGLGSVMLNKIKHKFSESMIILEVESPVDEMSQRRVGFYERNGFILNPYHYIQPALRQGVPSIDLMLMSYPKPINDEYDFDIIKKQIFKIVYHQTV